MNRKENRCHEGESAVSRRKAFLHIVKGRRGARRFSRGNLATGRQHRLIVASREAGFRMARRMLRAWSAPLDRDETRSLVDLALVKAARCFRPEEGSRFTSYLYFFLHGELTRAVGRAMRENNTLSLEQLRESRRRGPGSDSDSDDSLRISCQDGALFEGTDSPEHQAYLSEIRLRCRNAFAKLTHFEQRVVEAVHINGMQVTAAARRLGFSRGHVSKTRTDALKKLRPELEMLRPAA